MVKRVKTVQESDLRMLGSLARNIQRVLPVTQADIDAAAALGKGWVVWKVFEVSDPLDNLRGGTQLIIRQNSIQPGQNVRRVIFVSGPGGQTVIIRGTDYIVLPDAVANSLSYVKAFGGTEQRNLPDGYIQRQFIYMMDGSYLLTDVVPTFAGHYELEMQTTSVTTNTVTYLGSRDESSGNGGLRFAHLSDKTFRILGFGVSSDSSGTAANNTKYKFIWDNGSFWVYSGTTLIHSGTFTEETMPTTTPLAINGWNSGGTIGGNIEGIYLYSFKAWNAQGELVADYVPAVQKGTVPVVGFYDTVSKTFKTATSGTFAAGGEAVPTPDTPMDIVSNNGVLKVRDKSGLPFEYQKVEFLQSSNKEFIDLGYTLNTATDDVELDIQLLSDSSSTNFFGARTTTSSRVYTLATSVSGGVCRWRFGWKSSSSSTGVTADTNRHTLKINHTAQTLSLDGVIIDTRTDAANTTTPTTATLFAIHSTQGDIYYFGSVKIFGYKKWTNNVLSQNLIPCRRKSDSVLGMYDLISNTFLTNGGTGAFTAGADIDDPEIYADGTVETINVHGKNLFDKDTVNLGKRLDDSGNILNESNGFVSAKIYVVPNTTYTWQQATTGGIYLRICEYNSGGFVKLNKGGSAGTQTLTFTTSANTSYVLVSSYGAVLDKNQLELGSTATTYEPYYNGGTATAEMLLKVGDYQDIQSIIDGVVTRNVGVKVLDGTESWTYRNTQSGYATFQLSPSVLYSLTGIPHIICSHFADKGPVNGISVVYQMGVGIALYKSSDYPTGKNLYLNIPTSLATDITTFKQWLADQYAAGAPVIIIYPLGTPTTESVAGQTLQVQNGDNTLEITQASLTGLELEAQYNAAVSLTIQEVQDANLDNNVTVTIQ